MPTTRLQAKNDRHKGGKMLLALPNEIKTKIFTLVIQTPKGKTYVFQPRKAVYCCTDCRGAEMRRRSKNGKEKWLPWILTQVSKDYNMVWQPFDTSRTKHLVCPFQLKDYMATCLMTPKGDDVVDKRLRPPLNYVYVRLTAENIIRVPLQEIYEATAIFHQHRTKLHVSLNLGGCGEQKVSKEERNRRHSVFQQLGALIVNDLARDLLPGTGIISSIFMDQYTNIWLHPTAEYLLLHPALEAGLRGALYKLRTSAAVASLNLLVHPLREDNGQGILSHEYEHHCQLSDSFWNQHPHKSHILSVRSIEFYKHNFRGVSALIIKPKGYVLSEGYSLKEIGINDEKIHAAGGATVYLQLVDAEDQTFDIQLED
ncbi:hypothetical protein AU210_016266 [Fusarium oxysporum f. sp. radicis-cucumerinum]|uniref:Uncharacterized protein n=1 Tax=Fusarium oxysporum f. sp. radicis-cucumerinum TaxID=327505 RepID=A0A2H3FS97_FUSOX|nr:hypothetical protein AU210_016266 [Fusarium oxysporum f. sp. radicis-cucumerinum]